MTQGIKAMRISSVHFTIENRTEIMNMIKFIKENFLTSFLNSKATA